eukprot:7196410-Prymnesium_polylepis.2
MDDVEGGGGDAIPAADADNRRLVEPRPTSHSSSGSAHQARTASPLVCSCAGAPPPEDEDEEATVATATERASEPSACSASVTVISPGDTSEGAAREPAEKRSVSATPVEVSRSGRERVVEVGAGCAAAAAAVASAAAIGTRGALWWWYPPGAIGAAVGSSGNQMSSCVASGTHAHGTSRAR